MPTSVPELPAVDSIWQHNDGRIIRVIDWTRPTLYPRDDYWANCTVKNQKKGQRKTITMTLKNFGKSLKLIAAITK